MITSSNIHSLRSGEAVAFFDNIHSILSTFDLAALQLDAYTAPLLDSYEEMKGLYKNERGSKITRELIELDKKRDTFFTALRNILLEHKRGHPSEEAQGQADDLHDILTRFGDNLHRKNYQEQTAGIDSITKTIDANAKALNDLNTLHLTVYYEAMKAANTLFNDTYLLRNSEYATVPKEKLTEVRDRTEEAFNTLVRKINAYLELSDEPVPYQALAGKIDALVETYQQVAERRSSIKSKAEETDEVTDADFEELEG